MRFVLVVGSTRTATIEGISAAGADSSVVLHTPAADAEIVEYGRPVQAPVTPVSPTGCPTPAVVTRAVRELVEFETLVVDAGLATRTAAPTVSVGEGPGEDIRVPEPVPSAAAIFERAHTLGRAIPDSEIVVGESIPGGTTTALGVMTALGLAFDVSSSLEENPLHLKRTVVSEALAASELSEGDASSDPIRAIQLMGDPVLAAIAGTVLGAIETGATVTLAGGTQMIAAAGLIRRFDVRAPITLATTSFVVEDETAEIEHAAEELRLTLRITDPTFDRTDHEPLRQYCRGEAKEGVGMGGSLFLATQEDVPMDVVRQRSIHCYERVLDTDGS